MKFFIYWWIEPRTAYIFDIFCEESWEKAIQRIARNIKIPPEKLGNFDWMANISDYNTTFPLIPAKVIRINCGSKELLSEISIPPGTDPGLVSGMVHLVEERKTTGVASKNRRFCLVPFVGIEVPTELAG